MGNAANVPVPCAGGAYAYGYPYAGYGAIYGKREAEAEPEADPALLYGTYGYGPLAYGLKSAPCVNAANVPVPCAGAAYAYGYPYAGYGAIYGKSEAEAEPEADPALLYGGLAAYPYAGYATYGAYPFVYGAGIAKTNDVLGHAVAHTGYGAVVHSSHVGVCTNNLGEQVSC